MEIRSDLSRHSRSSTILEEIPRSAGELSGFPVTHGLRRGLYSCAASRLLVTNDQRATLGREPHSTCVSTLPANSAPRAESGGSNPPRAIFPARAATVA